MKLFFTLLAATLALAAQEESENKIDCDTEPKHQPNPTECCVMPDVMPQVASEAHNFTQCATEKAAKLMTEMKPPTNGIFVLKPTDPKSQVIACVEQCVFSVLDLVDGEKNLNKTAIRAFFTTRVNKEMAPSVESVTEKCFNTYLNDVAKEQECKSGAMEFLSCQIRELFLNCPAKYWVNSDECGKLKTRVQKCPELQPILQSAVVDVPSPDDNESEEDA